MGAIYRTSDDFRESRRGHRWGDLRERPPVPRSTRQLRVLGSDHVAAATAQDTLIERAVELEVIGDAVRRLEQRHGAVVVLEASAGLGKTALLEHTARLAAEAGCLVRHAAPGPLERQFPFGVVRSLLEAPLRGASAEERQQLLEGAAAAVGSLLLEGTLPANDAAMVLAHSVLWLCSAIADRQPLALVIDDAQWADRSSLQVLSYLARRVDDLPLLIAVAARSDDPEAASDLLSLLGGARAAAVLHPQPLTVAAGARLLRRLAPGIPIAVCRDCHRSVSGNPWLLGELGRQIATYGVAAVDDGDQEAAPVSAIARDVVRRRLAALSPRDRAVVEALSVIGDGATPLVIAATAAVAVAEVDPARDALLAAGLLGPDRGRFAHGLIAVAIREHLSRTERERLHREAARALVEVTAGADVVASHLLRCGPQADPEVSALLVRAASSAAERGELPTAAAYLERALGERAPGDDRGRMLGQLATVAFDAGLPDSRGHLREALSAASDRPGRVEVLTRLAALNVVDGADDGLVRRFEQELVLGTDPDERLAVQTAALDALLIVPKCHGERAQRAAAIDLNATSDPLLRRTVLAHRAWLAVELGTLDAKACASLALEALEGDYLLQEAGRRPAYHLCTRTLVLSGHADQARRAITALRQEAMARGSLRLRAGAAWYAADLELRTGRVADAETEARLALHLVDEDLNTFTGGAIGVLLCALAERGAFQEARELLCERGLDGALGDIPWQIGVRHARARLWLAEGDFEQALAEAYVVGALRERQGRPNPTWTAWRSTAALALAHLGRREEAVVLADAELALAEGFGAPAQIAGALHARAVAEADDAARVELCERALAVLGGEPAMLESVRLRLELGSTLARTGRRVQARDALRPALADADAVGAVLLAQRARRELVATGLRPRHAALQGSAALTPRQRQVCGLAATGKGNRAIAQELFLSLKTVETHLAAGYRKLGVSARAELAAKLAA